MSRSGQLPCCQISGSCHDFLPPLLARAGQRPFAPPCGGSLLLRHVGFPCSHVLSRLPSAGCVGFPLLGCLRCLGPVGSVGFPLPSFPGSFNVFRPLVVRLHSCSPSSCTAASLPRCRRVSSPSYPWTLELRLCRTQLAWNTPGLASPSSLFKTDDQSVLKRLTPAFVAPLLSPPSGML
jgi:hypothetical protein